MKSSILLMGMIAALLSPVRANNKIVTDFTEEQNKALKWRIVNDGVMGGLSRGKVLFSDKGSMLFSGTLSLENNGGFSSVRSDDLDLDLADYEGLAIRVRGDGRTYQLRLSTDESYRSGEVGFKAEFPTTKGKWRQVRVPFRDLVGSWRGRLLKDLKFDPAKIKRVTLLLGDKRPGPFKLEVDWIRAYGLDSFAASDNKLGDLVETALSDGRFETLATALTKAELVEDLKGEGPLTVFAPTDAAFAKLPKETLAGLLEPGSRDELKAVLGYHVVPGQVSLSAALAAGGAETLQGERVNVRFTNARVLVNDAELINADIKCLNGVIHVVESVLLPPKPQRDSILDVARRAGDFGSLLAAIEAAGLSSVLEGEGPFTVFAPNDVAVDNFSQDTAALLSSENRDLLKSVLTYHVVGGNISAGDALNAGNLKTVNGQTLSVTFRDGQLLVNDSAVRATDLSAANGTIHVIDGVLMPDIADKPDKKTTPESAAQRILSAIDKGVPLYNRGQPAACAEVYADCVQDLSGDETMELDFRKNLTSVLEKAKITRSADSRAWLLRRTLDGALVRLGR